MPLSDIKIRNIKPTDKPQKLTDSGGLYLEVKPTGSKLWRYRFRIEGKENTLSLGAYPLVSLAEAREARDKAKKLVSKGISPTLQKRAEKAARAASRKNTFKVVALEYYKQKKPRWADGSARLFLGTLELNVFPYIGALPARDVKPAHILDILKRIEKRGAPNQALFTRQVCSAIFRYAVVTLRAETDPAAPLIGAIHKPKTRHHKPLTKNELPLFFDGLKSYGGQFTTKIMLELLALLFVRPSELRRSQWSEFDLENALWVIPAERMKMRELHKVPLSKQAIKLLLELQKITGKKEGVLFPNRTNPNKPTDESVLNEALKKMGLGVGGFGFSSHGFRATASTMLNELGFRADLIERQLAHKEPNASRQAYNRAEYMPERIAMMQTWADLLDTFKEGSTNIIPLRVHKQNG